MNKRSKGLKASLITLLLLSMSALLAGCVTGEPFLTKETRLKNGKEYRLEIGGEFKKPEGTGPFPTVIILQSCGGTTASLYGWADKFKEWGYASFRVKSLEARGMQVCEKTSFNRAIMYADVASDAFGALEHLSKRSDVDPTKIAVIGFSMGAGAINDWILTKPQAPGPVDFVGAISFYQYCNSAMRALNRYPVLQVTASLDYNHSPTCENYKSTWSKYSVFEPDVAKNLDRLTVVTYKNIHHAFDDSKHSSMRADVSGNTMLYDRKAHQASITEVKNFLNKIFSK